MLITIFTPTFNRANRLSTLYKSLCRQTDKDFEWLVVDDGSEDNTSEVMAGFINEGIIPIRFFIQENKGKHVAINKGVNNAAGDLFWCVDSDDYIADDAIAWIRDACADIWEDTRFIGICGEKAFFNGSPVESRPKEEVIDSNALEIMFSYRVQGDMAEIFKTSILSHYPFPENPGEKFCAESLVWNRIAQRYGIRYYFNKIIYYCEYLPDGLSARSIRLRHSSPRNTMTLYAELAHYNIPFVFQVKAYVNFWRFYTPKNRDILRAKKMLNILSILALPIGLLMGLIDRIKIQ